MESGYDWQAQLFRALAHPVRLQILDILAQGEACVCHLTAVLGQRQPYISQQLATLRDAGLVLDRREGTLIYYRLAGEQLPAMLDEGKALARHLGGEGLGFPSLPDAVHDGCPCPRCQAG